MPRTRQVKSKHAGNGTIQSTKILGKAYEQLIKLVTAYAEKDFPILLVGESGTGKELFAQHFMATSNRKGKRLTINCASLEDALLRSEIFGHEKGAFTGASAGRKGKLETCEGGILFLDEFGDASPQLQANILRVAEGNSYSRLGGDEEKKVDVLLVAATNKPNAIREDLKMRFHILHVPPLQKMDIPVLAEHFLKHPLKGETIKRLTKQYPGNIRELKRECEKLLIEEGEKLFSSKGYVSPPSLFDYERFDREIRTWNKYLQPIIDRHDLIYKYQYLSKKKSRVSEPLTDCASLTYGGASIKSSSYFISEPVMEENCMMALIRELRNGNLNVLQSFSRNLELQFSEFELPYLLKALDEFGLLSRHDINLSRLFSLNTSNKPNSDTHIEKPDMAPLLDLPLKEAEARFRQTYLKYRVSQHPHHREEAAAASGLTLAGFNSKFSRSGKVTEREVSRS